MGWGSGGVGVGVGGKKALVGWWMDFVRAREVEAERATPTVEMSITVAKQTTILLGSG